MRKLLPLVLIMSLCCGCTLTIGAKRCHGQDFFPAQSSSWGSSGCGSGRSPLIPQVFPNLPRNQEYMVHPRAEWKTTKEQPHVRHLFVNGVQVGSLNLKSQVWQDYDAQADKWGKPVNLVK